MTKKQEQILQTSITLFLELGYRATTSKKIAVKAEVSEGLIFRHFTDKEGLLKAVVHLCDESLSPILTNFNFEEDLKLLLKKIILLPITLYRINNNSLKVLFKLNHELGKDNSMSLSLLKRLLENTFEQLNYKHAKLETKLLLYYLDGMTSNAYSKSEDDLKEMQNFVLKKYYLN